MKRERVIVHVVPGGSENRLLQNIFFNSPENSNIISLSWPDKYIGDWTSSQNIPYWNLNQELSLRKPLNLIVIAIRMQQLFKEINPTHVYFHSFMPSLLSALIFPFRKETQFIPVRHHNLVHHILRKSLYIRLDRFIGKFSDAVVAVSDSVKETIGIDGTPLTKVHVIFNAMSFERYSRNKVLDKDAPKLLAIGRIDWQKNYPDMIHMLSLVKDKYPGVTLQILGDGDSKLKGKLLEQVSQLGLEENISFLGWRENVSEFFADADLFVHSALDEACPLVLLEALAAEIPIVSTGNGGCKDVLDGFYESVDTSSRQVFAAAVINGIEQNEELNRRAKEIKRPAMEKFNVAKMSRDYVDLTLKLRGKN
ncbi:RfaG Glycosyltransferase [Candidatus Nanopelagicaceae bacterium]